MVKNRTAVLRRSVKVLIQYFTKVVLSAQESLKISIDVLGACDRMR